MDSLLGAIVLLIITALSSWMQKRAQSKRDESESEPLPPRPKAPPRIPRATEPAPPPATPPPRRSQWEEDLRRLLEGETESETAAEPPVMVRREVQSPPPPAPPAPRPPGAPPVVLTAEAEGPSLNQRLAEAEAAYAKARQLHEETARRLQDVVAQTKRRVTTAERAGEPHRDTAAAIRLLSQPQGLRQAIIAAVVLSPPKGMEP